jgi:uncharacterized protein (TIRG00374 family)
MNRRPLYLVLRGLVIALVVAALVLFAVRVQWGETWLAMRGASLGVLLLAAIVNLLSLALKGVRWWLFLRVVNAGSLWLALRGTFAGAALNNILVANVGEPARVLLVARSSGAKSEEVFATLALERLFEFSGYVVLLAASVSLLPLPPNLAGARPYAFAVLALVIGVLIYLVRHPNRVVPPVVVPTTLRQRLLLFWRGFLQALSRVSSGRRFTVAMLLSVVVWTLQVLTYQLTAQAANFDIPVVGTLAAILSVNIGFAVRATPGNVGVFQAIYAMTAVAFGLDGDAAVGVALLIQAQQILPVTVLGILAAPRMLLRPGSRLAAAD